MGLFRGLVGLEARLEKMAERVAGDKVEVSRRQGGRWREDIMGCGRAVCGVLLSDRVFGTFKRQRKKLRNTSERKSHQQRNLRGWERMK